MMSYAAGETERETMSSSGLREAGRAVCRRHSACGASASNEVGQLDRPPRGREMARCGMGRKTQARLRFAGFLPDRTALLGSKTGWQGVQHPETFLGPSCSLIGRQDRAHVDRPRRASFWNRPMLSMRLCLCKTLGCGREMRVEARKRNDVIVEPVINRSTGLVQSISCREI
ncbi:hypothetical protein LX36DRAFT_341897 [Colletotrichum falcatum]|nr:hypothetical protein LX36DRAFT_341897 [Colletotrichum falcatum]